jgi:large subunit ribosomal protein L43
MSPNKTPPSSFLKTQLQRFARDNPQVEVTVSPRPGRHPVLKGKYICGKEKAICVRNMEPNEILEKALLLRNASGETLKRVTKPVKSLNESVRGIWSPFHGQKYQV